MEELKLLQLNVTSNWGSTGKIAESIGDIAIKNGWASYIGYGRYSNPSSSITLKVGHQHDVYYHYFKNIIFDGEGLGSKNPTFKLIHQIDKIKPDIIHLHNIHDHWINYPILFNFFHSIDTPIVWTFHDCWAFTGGCFHFESEGCYKWITKCDNCNIKNKVLINRSLRNFNLKKSLLSKLNDKLTIVGVSDWITNLAKKSFLQDANFLTIYNGIDISKFSINTNKQNYILGVSNIWSSSKGLDDFIQLRQFIPSNIDIVLIGLNKNQISNLPKGITGLPRTSTFKELENYYQNALAFVNPTKNDSFPTVNLEALACGTPVITYKTGGCPEAVDEKTGLVIEKGNVKELAHAINNVINQKIIFNPQDCRDRVIRHFNKNVQFEKYMNLYYSLLKNN